MRPAGRWRGARDGGGARVGGAELAEAGTAIGRRGQRGRGGGGGGRDRREDRGRSWRRLAARRGGEGSEGAAAAGETDARAEGGARAAASAQAGQRREQDGGTSRTASETGRNCRFELEPPIRFQRTADAEGAILSERRGRHTGEADTRGRADSLYFFM